MDLKDGDLVRHISHPEFGVGIVLTKITRRSGWIGWPEREDEQTLEMFKNLEKVEE